MSAPSSLVLRFDELGRDDVALVGGKNASLGEMVRHLGARGGRVPPGFAPTAEAYRRFVDANGLRETIRADLGRKAAGKATLAEAGAAIRRAFFEADWPAELAGAITGAYRELSRRAALGHSGIGEETPERI